MTKQQLTREGYQKLQQELTDLRAKADHLIGQVEEVAQPDESGEDSLVSQLKAELEVVNSKIDSLEEALENAQIINGNLSKTIVCVGSRVKIRISGKVEKEFYVVSEFEADPSANKISDQSPLGKALIGKRVKDNFEIEAPVGKLTYKVVSIN
jgi:transcription elongation factor GreA